MRLVLTTCSSARPRSPGRFSRLDALRASLDAGLFPNLISDFAGELSFN
jgi:hypothetical protein